MKEQLQSYSILYVENEPSLRKELANTLKSHFKQMWLASDGDEALRLYETHFPDVIMLDLDLPRVNGLSLCKYIREHNKAVRIIMLISHIDEEQVIEQAEIDVTRCLLKPVRVRPFKEAMEKVSTELIGLYPHMVRLNENVTWDEHHRMLFINKTPVSLTIKEATLLDLLIRHAGSCVRFETILENVWENSPLNDTNLQLIVTQVNQLRKKLPADLIQNVYRQGYVLSRKR